MTRFCACGAPLIRKRWRPGVWENRADWQRRRFCGRACEVAARGPRPGPATLMAHRMRARKKRGWLCERCGSFPVDAHHANGNPWDDAGPIETLCRLCHAKADAALRRAAMPWEWKRV